ncbi:Broad specificity phosphatase PhoE [Ruegeria halocynthiae]|uniref:Broad specificity phosphatase PhoE n=1 Tax=Ruegeria halocynthiae TaxID=985054 RepID=A0A1H2RRS0_9RHOB|nr:histidine phosphatase family protein [Ruegeria halocynthiae]SDW22213.1 Broad specificity phosphatase PhoE [Ruegeria halocynthiae]
MQKLLIISHPEVAITPDVPVTDWGLSEIGRRRAAAFATGEILSKVTQIWTSTEQKARDTAEILAAPRNLPVNQNAALGENNRSATGFLPRDAFEAAADAFFAHPDISFHGWETAVEAQQRIHRATISIIEIHDGNDLAIVTHGAVGTLLWCALSGYPIDRKYDQPSQGHYWQADLKSHKPLTGWCSLD